MAQSCLSIVIAQLEKDNFDPSTDIGQEIPLPEDNLYTRYVNIDTITKMSIDRTPVYDEGEHRVLYIENVVSIEAILNAENDFGTYIDGPSDPPPFYKRLESIQHFLDNQGLAINFVSQPDSIRRMVPGYYDEDPVLPDAPNVEGNRAGWLIDNFNGPLNQGCNIETVVGDETALMTYQVKYKTSHSEDENNPNEFLLPKLSMELRLDIDEEGNINIIVAGTIYADSLAALYQARDHIIVQYQPATIGGIKLGHVSTWTEDQWAQVNGFQKQVQFNVEKNGRSARFSINYRQVKSLNALPLGIRDIEFTQELSSSLYGKGPFEGHAFTRWKNVFKGRITLPPRFPAIYGYQVWKLLVMQQMRNSEKVWDSKWLETNEQALTGGVDLPPPEAQGDAGQETGGKIKNVKDFSRSIPVRIKMKNNHFAKQLSFETQFMTVCPLNKIIAASCIFERVNNEYQRSLPDQPDAENYVPIQLSAQWWNYNASIDPQFGFNPTQPYAVNPFNPGLPHRDGAGLEIKDTGHKYDAYKPLDLQPQQKVQLISTVIDPNEEDEIYKNPDPTTPYPGYQGDDPYPMVRHSGLEADYEKNKNRWQGNLQRFLSYDLGNGRMRDYISPKVSWVTYNQSYTIRETNPTIPTEALADIKAEDFDSTRLETQYGLDNPQAGNGDQARDGVGFYVDGRKTPQDNDSSYVRKTYASKPPRYYITVTGRAVRVGYKIPIPQLVYFAGQKAVRVGDGLYRSENLNGNAVMPVYVATWKQTYSVDKSAASVDFLQEIEDTGASILYG